MIVTNQLLLSSVKEKIENEIKDVIVGINEIVRLRVIPWREGINE